MRILITGAYNWTEQQIAWLIEKGWQVEYVEREDGKLDINKELVDVVICNWLFVHHDINEFSNLKMIQLLSAGTDRVPLGYIEDKNIKLYNARGVYSIPMAECAIGGVLYFYKRSGYFASNKKEKKWKKSTELKELFGKSVCIIGMGSVGQEVAKKFSAFTDNIVGFDLLPQPNVYCRSVLSVELLEKHLEEYDVVILTLPLSDETKGFFDKRKFKLLREDAVFVNISRGQLVDEEALKEALKGQLLGAVCDVYETEPLPEDSELWEIENLFITPHVSYVSDNNQYRMWEVIKNNINEFQTDNM